MNRAQALVLSLSLASLAACGPAAPAQTAEPGKEEARAEPSATPSAEAPKPDGAEAPKAEPAAAASPLESLARDLIKSGGRRIGWSATKKRFIVPIELRASGGRGLNLHVYDDDAQQREIQRICQPGECEDRLDEIAREKLPALVTFLDQNGYEAVNAVGWPSGRDEIDVGTLGGKLRYERGRLSLALEKKTTPLRGGRSPKGAAISAVYPVPSAKLLGVVFEGEKDFYVFKLP